MFMNDVQKKEEIRNIAIQDLRNFGIKYRPKKNKTVVQETKSRKVFKVPLQNLPMQIVTLPSGQQLIVPKLVHEMCSFTLTKVETEGLFRKGGSKSRQNEIKLSLDAGCYLGEEHHEIDVASVLKTFFRELPEPLFPYHAHDMFLKCMLLDKRQIDAVFLMCLLLPCEHLNTLSYFMQFLRQVSDYSSLNKMDAFNLSIVIGPTLMPLEEKAVTNNIRLSKTCELVKLLIENASKIGVLPSHIIERIALSSSCISLADEELLNSKKKKKRRSGSLTRMFNGLKKIVGSKADEATSPATPDLLQTPSISRTAKKRKIENGLSAKKRKEILHNLPQRSALSTPFTPSRTPVCIDPNPKKKTTPNTCQKETCGPDKLEMTKEKKHQWYLRKPRKADEDTTSVTSKSSAKSMLERRWSAVSQVASFKKNKKRNSCAANLNHLKGVRVVNNSNENISASPHSSEVEVTSEPQLDEPDYVRISKVEYEEIKNRVSAIENRISLELNAVENDNNSANNPIENVVNAYEKTLEEVEPLSPTTDHLARRLSRELKIRRSADQKVFRSPSARKIGSIRRRSRELERQQNVRLHRNQSWHVTSNMAIPRASLKRGRPNTVLSGLIKTPVKISEAGPEPITPKIPTRRTTRSSSFHNKTITTPSPYKAGSSSASKIHNITHSHKQNSSIKATSSSSNSEKWTSAEGFFNSNNCITPINNMETCRSSIARIRSQNAGMVLAKARLFDEMLDSDSSNQKSMPSLQPRTKPTNKIGSVRNIDRQNCRVRTLKAEERRYVKKNTSPRRRTVKSPTNRTQKLQIARVLHEQKNEKENGGILDDLNGVTIQKVDPLKDVNRLSSNEMGNKTPCFNTSRNNNIPPIKKTLIVKSPKRLHKTPHKNDNRQTPLKAVTTPRHVNV